MEEFEKEGKCVFCSFHQVIELSSFIQCQNQSEGISIRPTCPGGGDYPDQFLPSALSGTCTNWKLKSYKEG